MNLNLFFHKYHSVQTRAHVGAYAGAHLQSVGGGDAPGSQCRLQQRAVVLTEGIKGVDGEVGRDMS